MGLKARSTEGNGVSNLERLQCIGNGWDLNVAKMFFPHLSSKKTMTHAEVMVAIAEGPALNLDLTEEEREFQYALVYTKEKLSPEDFVEEISQWSEADQLKATILLKDFSCKALAVSDEDENILDSGSGRHVNRNVRILDPDSTVSLTGFDDSKQWTQGIGFLPLEAHDEFTNEDFKFDIVGVDQLDTVMSSIFSLGKLYKDGVHWPRAFMTKVRSYTSGKRP